MYKWNSNKKLVYWGAGEVGKKCLLIDSQLQPQFVIDSYVTSMDGIELDIVNPNRIENWSEYFIVITVEKKDGIKKELNYRGLCENEDYVDYEIFFGFPASDSQGTLDYARKQMESGQIHPGMDIIGIPFYFSQRMKPVKIFFMNYIKKHGAEKFLILHGVQYIDDPNMKSDFACCKLPYRIPEIQHLAETKWQEKLKNLTEEEIQAIDEIEFRKAKRNPIPLIQLRYIYYKELFQILKPRSVIWWGGWARDTYIIQMIAKEQKFHFAVGEHGWIKGTVNIDKEGIAGQSKFCNLQNSYDNLLDKKEYDVNVWERIKRELLSKETEGTIDQTEWEKILSLDERRPTFLMIGMGDYGMDMNPNVTYWKEKISSCVTGSLNAVHKCVAICQKYGWNFIYKPHPKEAEEQVLEEIQIPGVTFVQSVPIERLINRANVSISITSAVDFNVLLHDKPLVQLGKNSLVTAKCTYLVHCEKEIEEQMLAALANGFTEEQKENYARHMLMLLKTVLWDDCSNRAIRYGRNVEEDIFYDQ